MRDSEKLLEICSPTFPYLTFHMSVLDDDVLQHSILWIRFQDYSSPSSPSSLLPFLLYRFFGHLLLVKGAVESVPAELALALVSTSLTGKASASEARLRRARIRFAATNFDRMVASFRRAILAIAADAAFASVVAIAIAFQGGVDRISFRMSS